MLAALCASFGRRNLAFLAFTGLLFLFAIWLESTSKSSGPDRGGGYMLGIALWFIASLASVGVNGVLFFVGLSNKRPVIKEVIGVALPFVLVALVLGLEGLFA